jgi:hypothetical protein
VVAVGEQDPLAEVLGFQPWRAWLSMRQDSRMVAGRVPVRVTCRTRDTQRGSVIWAISASTWARGRRVWPRASRVARADSCRSALARVWSKPRAWRAWKVGEWVKITRRVAPSASVVASAAVSPPNRSGSTSR